MKHGKIRISNYRSIYDNRMIEAKKKGGIIAKRYGETVCVSDPDSKRSFATSRRQANNTIRSKGPWRIFHAMPNEPVKVYHLTYSVPSDAAHTMQRLRDKGAAVWLKRGEVTL